MVCGGAPLPDEDGSTVDVQNLAGDEGRKLRGKEEHRARELLGPPDASQRNRRQDLLEYVLLGGFAACCGMMCFPAIAASATHLTAVMQGLVVAITRLAP